MIPSIVREAPGLTLKDYYLIIIMALNIRALLSVCAQLSLESCSIVRQNLDSDSYQQYMKAENDPITDVISPIKVHYKIQALIKKAINIHFPALKIIAKQSEQDKISIDFDYAKIQTDIIPENYRIHQQFNTQDCCLWIDAIDCSGGLVGDNCEDVTISIGLSHKNKAEAGIIGSPFRMLGGNKLFSPVITIGSVKNRQALDFNGIDWVKKEKPKIHKPLKIVTSNVCLTQQQQVFLKTLRAQSIRAGGSGRKAMMVANGEADAMVYFQSGTHKWGSCAGDAIMKAMGGYFTNPYGTNITYNPNAISTENKLGIVASLDRQVFEKCMDAIAFF